ncbi:fumarylacetoacetate hydrolase family protein [Mesorhizobium sp. 1M-11]|uniref:fumarylacetoacetate hydrolase family protein n=1 Tax=Mesorhizobium sp. 1M-11 TaxID=1529006 RepID=UPI0006C73BA3|nr:fumarylacetoacetate hydrolase family protein [Mesorhizobium sp. 1M-11]
MLVLFEPCHPTLLQTTTADSYPVRRVFCIGRNYEAHAREMGRDPDREPPFFFTKWAETVVNADPDDACRIAYPPETHNFHFEIELVVAIGKAGFRIDAAEAEQVIWGYAVGLDMTRRDLQLEARDLGRPWDTGKNVEQSSPMGRLVARDAARPNGFDPGSGRITLSVDGIVKQDADLSELIWPVKDIVAHVSRFYRLAPGDLIFTGTPAGVGAVVPGNRLVGEIAGLPPLEITVAPPADS